MFLSRRNFPSRFSIIPAKSGKPHKTRQGAVEVSIKDSTPGNIIPKEIYGQFSEHLGHCIYDGLWVGPDSPIPNMQGYRKDILEALKGLHIPVLR